MAFETVEVKYDETEIVKPGEAVGGDVLIEGTYKSVKEVEAKNGDGMIKLYLFDQKGDEAGIWGTAVLNRLMPSVNPGDLVRITYKGKGVAAPGKSAPHQFLVERDASGGDTGAF